MVKKKGHSIDAHSCLPVGRLGLRHGLLRLSGFAGAKRDVDSLYKNAYCLYIVHIKPLTYYVPTYQVKFKNKWLRRINEISGWKARKGCHCEV